MLDDYVLPNNEMGLLSNDTTFGSGKTDWSNHSALIVQDL